MADGTLLAVTDTEMAKMPNKTERVPVGEHKGEWMVGVAVAHQLHCLDRLRMSLYPNVYHESIWYANGSLNAVKWTHHGEDHASLVKSLY